MFALRARDIGSVKPILSTSLQQQDIIHKTNINKHVARVHAHIHTHTDVLIFLLLWGTWIDIISLT